MTVDPTQCNSKALKEYFLSSASTCALGAAAEEKLQHTPDYLSAKQHITDNQRKIAFWDGMRSLGSLAGGIMSGMLGGAIISATKTAATGQGDFISNLNDPLVYISGGGVAGFTALNVYSNYRTNLIYNENSFTNMESGSRKQAEMSKLHAINSHELSLASSEYTARRVGEEVDRAMQRNLRPQPEIPQPMLNGVSFVSAGQQAVAR